MTLMLLPLKIPETLDVEAIHIVDSILAGLHPFERNAKGEPKGREVCNCGHVLLDERLCIEERELLHQVLTAYGLAVAARVRGEIALDSVG